MSIARRLLYREIVRAVSFVTTGFIGLFFFFDLIDEVQDAPDMHQKFDALLQTLTIVVLHIPHHIYELLPITTLMGTIFVMARFAQSGEFTIFRVSGLSSLRALGWLTSLGVGFVIATFLIGDYIAPFAERAIQSLQATSLGIRTTGAWLRDKQENATYIVNIGALNANGQMQDVRIIRLNPMGQMDAIQLAGQARFADNQTWLLTHVTQKIFTTKQDQDLTILTQSQLDQVVWPTHLTLEMVSAALLQPSGMSTIDLWRYGQHLNVNGQNSQTYAIEFWRKLFYPLSCLVMMVLALPFAYLQARKTHISTHVFVGVMLGISFFLLNNVFGYIGELHHWEPWIAAAMPGILYSSLSFLIFYLFVQRFN